MKVTVIWSKAIIKQKLLRKYTHMQTRKTGEEIVIAEK